MSTDDITLDDIRRAVLRREANAIVAQKLDAGEPVSKPWLVEIMLAKHPGEDAAVQDAVEKSFARFDTPDTPEGHGEHADELRRYLATRNVVPLRPKG